MYMDENPKTVDGVSFSTRTTDTQVALTKDFRKMYES